MSKINYHILSENAEDRVRINFGFSLCTVLLWVALVTYFERELGKLRRIEATRR